MFVWPLGRSGHIYPIVFMRVEHLGHHKWSEYGTVLNILMTLDDSQEYVYSVYWHPSGCL